MQDNWNDYPLIARRLHQRNSKMRMEEIDDQSVLDTLTKINDPNWPADQLPPQVIRAITLHWRGLCLENFPRDNPSGDSEL